MLLLRSGLAPLAQSWQLPQPCNRVEPGLFDSQPQTAGDRQCLLCYGQAVTTNTALVMLRVTLKSVFSSWAVRLRHNDGGSEAPLPLAASTQYRLLGLWTRSNDKEKRSWQRKHYYWPRIRRLFANHGLPLTYPVNPTDDRGSKSRRFLSSRLPAFRIFLLLPSE